MATPGATAGSREAIPAHTLRVTFAYRGDRIALAATRRVQMIAPPSVAPPPQTGQSGYWFEVRAADGSLLFHRGLHAPIRVDVEVFSDEGRQSIARVPVAEPRGEFEVLVPDLPGAQSFVLYGPPPKVEMQGAPAEPLVKLPFDELRRPSPARPPVPRDPRTGEGR
jgi:hypothetical protein